MGLGGRWVGAQGSADGARVHSRVRRRNVSFKWDVWEVWMVSFIHTAEKVK